MEASTKGCTTFVKAPTEVVEASVEAVEALEASTSFH